MIIQCFCINQNDFFYILYVVLIYVWSYICYVYFLVLVWVKDYIIFKFFFGKDFQVGI